MATIQRLSHFFVLATILVALSACDLANHESKEPNVFKSSPQNYVIFSPMEGVLMKDNKPLPNARIIRTLTWNGNEYGLVENFFSNEAGYFSLPVHEESLSLGALEQFSAHAELAVETAEGKYELWFSGKLQPEIYAETDGKLDGLVCDIANEEATVPMSPTAVITRCRWKGMP